MPYRFLPQCLLIASFLFAPALTASAQDGRFLGGLLKELLESEIRRRDEKKMRQRLAIPNQPPIVIPREIPANIRTAQGYCDSFAKESTRLIQILRQDARGLGGVRPCIDELLHLQARAQAMSARFGSPLERQLAIDDVRELDRNWRAASYRLQQVRGLPNNCTQVIDRLNGLNTKCCKLFDIGPQINRREVARIAHALAAEIHHLERDVQYEMRGRNAPKLVTRLRRAETAAKLLGQAAADGDAYEVVVAEFKEFVTMWRSISRPLDATNNRHILRTTEQINGLARAMHEQLWLPVGVDYAHIEHIATITAQRVKQLNDSFSLTMLTELPDAPAVVLSAQKLNKQLSEICACASKEGSTDVLVGHWTNLDQAWREFSLCTDPISAQQITRLRGEIAANLDAIRQGLGVQLAFDRQAVIRYAAELEGIALQAQRRVAMWQRRPGANVDAALIRSAKTLIADCRHLHEGCAGTESREHLARDVEKLGQAWTQLRPQLMRCRTVDQRALQRISDEATERLIHLQTMLQI